MAVKTPQVISPLPLPPNPADRSTFNTRAYPWSNALAPWTTQTNQAAADTYANAVDSAASATSANSSKNAAAGSASSASTDAGLANGYKNEAFVSKNAAASSASTANTSSGQAVTAKNEAQQWATSLTTVSGGLKGARGYANDAAQSAADAAAIVSGDIFDDTSIRSDRGWTSSKIFSSFINLLSDTPAAGKAVVGKSDGKIDSGWLDAVGNGKVMREGAGGWMGQGGATTTPLGYPTSVADITNLTKTIRSEAVDNGVVAYSSGIHFSAGDTWGRLRVSYLSSRAWVQGGNAGSGSGWTAELYHSANTLNIGTTAATARTALNLFADTSGVMTNGAGKLSSDMSSFLSSTTFQQMSDKLGGGSGEVNYTTLSNNAASLTPLPGNAYRMTRTTGSVLTTTLACTYKSDKIRSWHMIVSKGSGAGDNFIPKFALTGLTSSFAAWSGGASDPPVVSNVSHVLISFTQIDQSVRAMVVDGW